MQIDQIPAGLLLSPPPPTLQVPAAMTAAAQQQGSTQWRIWVAAAGACMYSTVTGGVWASPVPRDCSDRLPGIGGPADSDRRPQGAQGLHTLKPAPAGPHWRRLPSFGRTSQQQVRRSGRARGGEGGQGGGRSGRFTGRSASPPTCAASARTCGPAPPAADKIRTGSAARVGVAARLHRGAPSSHHRRRRVLRSTAPPPSACIR